MITTLALVTLFSLGSEYVTARGSAFDDRPRMTPEERSSIFRCLEDPSLDAASVLVRIDHPASKPVELPGHCVPTSLYWLRRVFRPEALPPIARISWSGSVIQDKLGSWEHVNATFRLYGRRTWWADGFTTEDPRAVSPLWLWIELEPGELDTSSRDGMETSVAHFMEQHFVKYDYAAPVTAKVWREPRALDMGYWGLVIGQDVPQRLPSPCGWMDSMNVQTNGRNLFVSVLRCTDSSFDWTPTKDYFAPVGEGYRRNSRFTGEPIRYAPELTTPGYVGRGGGQPQFSRLGLVQMMRTCSSASLRQQVQEVDPRRNHD